MVDTWCITDSAVAHSIADDFLDLCRAIAQFIQCSGHGLVDDLEIPATGKFLEFHQRKVRLDPCGVAIHDQTDRAGWRNNRDLRIAIAMRLAQFQGLVPSTHGNIDQTGIGAVGVIKRKRVGRQLFVTVRRAISGVTVVADDAQHVSGVFLVTGE